MTGEKEKERQPESRMLELRLKRHKNSREITRPRFLMRSKELREEFQVWSFTSHMDTEVGQGSGRDMYVWRSWVSEEAAPLRSNRPGGGWLIQEGRTVERGEWKVKLLLWKCAGVKAAVLLQRCLLNGWPADALKGHNTDELETVLRSEPKPPAQKLTSYRRAARVRSTRFQSCLIIPDDSRLQFVLEKNKRSPEPLFFYWVGSSSNK